MSENQKHIFKDVHCQSDLTLDPQHSEAMAMMGKKDGAISAQEDSCAAATFLNAVSNVHRDVGNCLTSSSESRSRDIAGTSPASGTSSVFLQITLGFWDQLTMMHGIKQTNQLFEIPHVDVNQH